MGMNRRSFLKIAGFAAIMGSRARARTILLWDAGVRLELHDIGLDAYPHLQLIGAMPESVIKYVEVTSLIRADRTRPGRLTPDPTLDDQGRLAIPLTPGMGIEPDWTYIYSHRLA